MTELRALQYRMIRDSPIMDYNYTVQEQRLSLVDVAVVRNNTLEFLRGDKKDIWPSQYGNILYIGKNLFSNDLIVCTYAYI